jgi:predicted small metal-binding protein
MEEVEPQVNQKIKEEHNEGSIDPTIRAAEERREE